jgi:hypothetical protein
MRVRPFALATVLGASLVSSFPAPSAAGSEIPVAPGQSIQAAIDAAVDGDVVTVEAGTFVEDIDFAGKAITVVGRGPASVILGTGLGPVVRFVSGETAASVLDSFTITGGAAPAGGGILVDRASPTILRNVVTENRASGQGSGIAVLGPASPQIVNNLLSYNTNLDGAGDPHTIQVLGATPAIVNNTIVEGDSNGILLNGTSSVATIVMNNVIAVNGTPGERRGRGICDFSGGAVIQYNTFHRNVVAALLTRTGQYRRVRAAERAFADPDFHDNTDRSPRFVDLRRGDFRLRVKSPARNAGNPDPAFANRDGTRNTMGHTGGPLAAPSVVRCTR